VKQTAIAAIRAWTVILALAAGVLLAACGDDSEDDVDPGAGNPKPAEVDAAALADAPPPLAALYDQGNELLPGGVDAFEAQLEKLRGHPVVVNKWASWCGPCRFEFPFFQELAAERGKKVAFLGINSEDSEEAAHTFLAELPLPYPSFSDPDSKIARSLDADREFPATVFIDSRGEQAFVKRGGYASKDDLAADIDRYAR
jgi:cytochrome c biogenesis protein CcmG/thiol:disulfide interchange protein DsbE